MSGRGPHGDELSARRILVVEQRAGDAAGGCTVHCDKANAAFAIPALDALEPLGVVELEFASISRAEGGRGVLQGAEANVFEGGDIQRRDWDDGDQRKFQIEISNFV